MNSASITKAIEGVEFTLREAKNRVEVLQRVLSDLSRLNNGTATNVQGGGQKKQAAKPSGSKVPTTGTRAEKRAEIASLLKAGVLKVSEIAEHVGVSEPTVRSVKAKIQEE